MGNKKLRQIDVIKAIAGKIKKEFNCTVYSDEVKKDFEMPCFFIKFINTYSPQTINFSENKSAVILTYFPVADSTEEDYFDVIDRIKDLFPLGIKVNDRYLHIDNINDTRIGEDQDILQLTIDIPYIEGMQKPVDNSEIAGDMDITIQNKRD